MAERKPLFLGSEGFSEEMAITDSLQLGGLTMGGNIAMATNKITGLGTATDANDAVTKGQLDSAVTGLAWKKPVSVIDIISDADQSGSPPTPSTGQAFVVNNWGVTYTDGDIIEWDGAAWVVIVDEGGTGEPLDGTRVVVAGPPGGTGAGSFASQEEKIGTYSTSTHAWSFVSPSEGWSVLVTGDGSVNEDNGFVFDGTDWIQFTGAGQINAGDGLSKDGNTLNVNVGDGVQISTDRVALDLVATNPGLELIGTTPDKKLQVKAGDGIERTAGGVAVNIGSQSGLQFTTGELFVDPGDGIELAAGGVAVKLAALPGLEFSTGALRAKVSGAAGVVIDGSGYLALEIDDTPDTLDVDGDGLRVVGLPSLFKINDSAVSANVTSTNLNALTGGGQTTLHSHAGSDEAKRIENDINVSEAIAIADPVYISGADTVGEADAAVDAKSRVIGIAITAQGTVGQPVTLVSHGEAAGVLAGATAGTPYYLQSGGGIGTSLPGGGNRVILIGWAVSSVDLWVNMIDYGKKAA